jgi:predicted kinase
MHEFLVREALTAQLRDKETNYVSFPPENRTNWDSSRLLRKSFLPWIRTVAVTPSWNFDKCLLVFPSQPGVKGMERLNASLSDWLHSSSPNDQNITNTTMTMQKPAPVDSPLHQRLAEVVASRRNFCWYDEEMQKARLVHLIATPETHLVVHFYAFLFFEDWRRDLWTKRLIRDHLRYVDAIQCAAARVVHALRERARQHGNADAVFHSLHVRRGDFNAIMPTNAQDLFESSHDVLPLHSTIYIATDEHNKTFFDIFRKHYHVYFLDDFMHHLKGIHRNLYGMIDQRVASRGETFVGTYTSTYSGYIHRMRGYHSQLEKAQGFESGIINSFYFQPEFKYAYRWYNPVTLPQWKREFPIGWRDIDRGL